jgi:hypothetical protein
MRKLALVFVLVPFLSLGCANSHLCEAGDQQECICIDGHSGSKVCLDGGDSWSECECPCQADCGNRECGLDPVCGVSCGSCVFKDHICVNGKCGLTNCNTSADCERIGTVCLVCVDNVCVEPPPVCQRQDHCCPGYFCNFGICVDGYDGCMSDADCGDPDFPHCIDGDCFPECLNDDDCRQADDICVNNHCVAPPGDGQPGDPCPLNGFNADEDTCAAEFTCLGKQDSSWGGSCPGGQDSECIVYNSNWNPECVEGICGASFCADPCVDDSCAQEFEPMEFDGHGCMCVPEISSDCSDPIDNIGCDEGYRCMFYFYGRLICAEEGTLEPGQECGEDIGTCVAGYLCWGHEGYNTCDKVCDFDAQTGCPVGFSCAAITEIERWGVCIDI